MSGTGPVGAVESKTVAYVIKGTYGGKYGEIIGTGIMWNSETPTRFNTVEDAVSAILLTLKDYVRGVTIERVVETTFSEIKTEYQPL